MIFVLGGRKFFRRYLSIVFASFQSLLDSRERLELGNQASRHISVSAVLYYFDPWQNDDF